MIYSAIHVTRHIYQSPVSQSLNELRLTPRSLPGQQVREVNICIEPEPATWQSRKDYFGNEVITVGVYEPHSRFVIEAKSVVEVEAPSKDGISSIAWEDARDRIAAHPDDETLAALEFVYDSPFIATADELAEYARPTFAPGRPLAEALYELSHRIYTEFKYKPNSTSIHMPLLEVLGKRQGVCQDFAHVMIGALRSLRPAGPLYQRISAQQPRQPWRRGLARLGRRLRSRERMVELRPYQRRDALRPPPDPGLWPGLRGCDTGQGRRRGGRLPQRGGRSDGEAVGR